MKNFQLIAHNPLIDSRFNVPRGAGGGITAIRDCLYVGTSSGVQRTLILDMKDMTKPTVIGELPGIDGQSMGGESIEGVADLNLLVNSAQSSKVQFENYKFPVAAADKNVGLVVYDATDCRKPTIVAKIDVFNERTHYHTLWRDPNKPERVLASLSYSGNQDGVDIRVWDLTGCPKTCNPKLVAEWGLRAQLGIPQTIVSKYEGGQRSDSTTTHDNTFSLDGKRIHLAQSKYGYLQIDSSALAEGRSCNPKAATSAAATGHCLSVFPNFKPLAAFGVEVANVHGVVKIPGRPYVAIQHEGAPCPWGGITFAYVGESDQVAAFDPQTNQLNSGGATSGAFRGDLFPRHVGSFALPENNPERCPKPGDQVPPTTGATGIYGADVLNSYANTVHNVVAFPSILIATWYSGGVRAVDITNPFTPFELGFFFNKPAAETRWCWSAFEGCRAAEVDAEGVPIRQRTLNPPTIQARSYPIVMSGHIVYADMNSGVYVLKYTGPHAEQIPQTGLCIAHNPGVVKAGFDPCPPYKG
jgi:hypothetical protein